MQEKEPYVKRSACMYLSWKFLGIHRYTYFLSALVLCSLAVD